MTLRLLVTMIPLVVSPAFVNAQQGLKGTTLVNSCSSITNIAVCESRNLCAYTESGKRSIQLVSLDGKRVNGFDGLPDHARSLGFSPDGRHLVATYAKGVAVCDIESGRLLTDKTPGTCLAAKYAPDGSLLLSSFGHQVAAWKRDGSFAWAAALQSSRIVALDVSSRSSFIATCSTAELVVYDRKTERVTARNRFDGGLNHCEFAADSSRVILAFDNKVAVLDWQKNVVVDEYRQDLFVISSTSYSHKDNSIYLVRGSGRPGSDAVMRIDIEARKQTVVYQNDRPLNVLQSIGERRLIVGFGRRDALFTSDEFGRIEIISVEE